MAIHSGCAESTNSNPTRTDVIKQSSVLCGFDFKISNSTEINGIWKAKTPIKSGTSTLNLYVAIDTNKFYTIAVCKDDSTDNTECSIAASPYEIMTNGTFRILESNTNNVKNGNNCNVSTNESISNYNIYGDTLVFSGSNRNPLELIRQ